MKDCAENRAKFVAAVSAWLLIPVLGEKSAVPQLSDYGLCRSCALELFSRFTELVMIYTHDVDAIVTMTQDQMADELPRSKKTLKH